MKFKKLLISASVVAASSGLLATVLTSCAKEDIDKDLKIELDDSGKLFDNSKLGDESLIDFKTAVKQALTRSSTWDTFKEALAEEIVYKWYEDRASKDKDDKTRNQGFRTLLDEWKYKADETYNDNLDSCKSKYGANYKFYFQNEYLAPNGGTEESYKHSLIMANVKADFVAKAFATSYFGILKSDPQNAGESFPHIFSDATIDINRLQLNKPETWPKLGFYAKVNKSFTPGDGTEIDPDYLSRQPDGDYAVIQNYVFNRWFTTEKPFFSSAALFKYSNPAQSGGKLDNIYNADTGVTIPTDNPNETFPFFGGVKITSNAYTGTNAYWQWYQALVTGSFETLGYFDADKTANGSISIAKKYTEDSQTVLLCSATQMIGGESALYVPYATAAASLYNQMMLDTEELDPAFAEVKNTMTQEKLEENVDLGHMPAGEDDARILKNFFFQGTADVPTTIKSYLDLNNVYGGEVNTTTHEYHCPLFKSDSSYTYFYGDKTQSGRASSGVRYITDNVQVNLGKAGSTTGTYVNQQPWVLELNETGMHAQTIDGFNYVYSFAPALRQEALKNFIKYRLMQKKQGYDNGIISADLLDGDSSKLKSYFEKNFADIVLEMACADVTTTDAETNIFRKVDSYKEATPASDTKFLNVIATDQKLATTDEEINGFKDYLNKTTQFAINKKQYDAIVKANDTIYGYRKPQIDNTRTYVGTKKFNNGLLSPMPYGYHNDYDSYRSTHAYNIVNLLFDPNSTKEASVTSLNNALTTIAGLSFVTAATTVAVDTDSGFSPQIKEAKKVNSNRFWYKSALVDKIMYSFMGNNTIANAIKQNSYEYYMQHAMSEDDFQMETILTSPEFAQAAASTYAKSKLLTGDKNYASYAENTTDNFFTIMNTALGLKVSEAHMTDGQYNDAALDQVLYYSTIAYLTKNHFANFYTELGKKIPGDDKAFVGYLTKYDIYGIPSIPEYNKPFTDSQLGSTPFVWKPDIDNIFDKAGYTGGTGAKLETPDRVSFDQYWNVVNKKFDVGQTTPTTLAGFLGLQTSSNVLCDDLKTAVNDKLYESVNGAPILGPAEGFYGYNDGALFAWAIPNKEEVVAEFAFNDITWKSPDGDKTITFEQFKPFGQAAKLASKIAGCSTIDDLKGYAKKIGDSLDGYTLFDQIADSTQVMTDDPINGYKYLMLEELLKKDDVSGVYHYANAFERLVNTQIHNPGIETEYLFVDGNDAYKLMITQLNKADFEFKTLAPISYDTAKGEWVMPEGCGITAPEFWFLLCQLATEPSIQQSAITDTVQTCYGEDRLIIYDAQLYNQFDSTWIKDWTKKPLGQ